MELTQTPDVAVPPRRFVPPEFDPSDLVALDRQVRMLLERPLANADSLRTWIVDWGELASCVGAQHTRRMTAMNRDTRNEALRERYLTYQKEIIPVWERHDDRLNRRYLACLHRDALGEEFEVFDRAKAKEAEIFREENTELSAQVEAHATRYLEVQGGVTVEFRGRTLTKEQCGAFLQDTDRATREEAYLALQQRMLGERDAVDDIYDKQIHLRHRIANNAEFDNFTEFRFAEMGRFDYTPADCVAYQNAVADVVVPALGELRTERLRRLGIETMRPYDREVGLFGHQPAQLFDSQDGYVALIDKVLRAVDRGFSADLDILVRNGLLDLMSRPGKAPGGYNAAVEDIRLPFIFYNAVGRRADVRTMLHEGGHAFHTLATRELEIFHYRTAPIEFCEVASMSMELFGFERLEGVLDADEFRDFAYGQFAGILAILASVALIDAFQMWIYAHPGHSREERRAQWVALSERFAPEVDWTGLEEFQASSWQRIPHLFCVPLYYIEYGIAQLGALQLWRKERQDHDAAIAGYREALALGGSRALPELFEAAGIRFAMDEAILRDLVPEVMAKLRGLLGS